MSEVNGEELVDIAAKAYLYMKRFPNPVIWKNERHGLNPLLWAQRVFRPYWDAKQAHRRYMADLNHWGENLTWEQENTSNAFIYDKAVEILLAETAQV